MDESHRGDPDRLDFSQFHDLAHLPFTAHCRSMYGGPWWHVCLWWEYIACPWIATRTRCRIGWHRWNKGRTRIGKPVTWCLFCVTLRDP